MNVETFFICSICSFIIIFNSAIRTNSYKDEWSIIRATWDETNTLLHSLRNGEDSKTIKNNRLDNDETPNDLVCIPNPT